MTILNPHRQVKIWLPETREDTGAREIAQLNELRLLNPKDEIYLVYDSDLSTAEVIDQMVLFCQKQGIVLKNINELVVNENLDQSFFDFYKQQITKYKDEQNITILNMARMALCLISDVIQPDQKPAIYSDWTHLLDTQALPKAVFIAPPILFEVTYEIDDRKPVNDVTEHCKDSLLIVLDMQNYCVKHWRQRVMRLMQHLNMSSWNLAEVFHEMHKNRTNSEMLLPSNACKTLTGRVLNSKEVKGGASLLHAINLHLSFNDSRKDFSSVNRCKLYRPRPIRQVSSNTQYEMSMGELRGNTDDTLVLHMIWLGSGLRSKDIDTIKHWKTVNPGYTIWLWVDEEWGPYIRKQVRSLCYVQVQNLSALVLLDKQQRFITRMSEDRKDGLLPNYVVMSQIYAYSILNTFGGWYAAMGAVPTVLDGMYADDNDLVGMRIQGCIIENQLWLSPSLMASRPGGLLIQLAVEIIDYIFEKMTGDYIQTLRSHNAIDRLHAMQNTTGFIARFVLLTVTVDKKSILRTNIAQSFDFIENLFLINALILDSCVSVYAQSLDKYYVWRVDGESTACVPCSWISDPEWTEFLFPWNMQRDLLLSNDNDCMSLDSSCNPTF